MDIKTHRTQRRAAERSLRHRNPIVSLSPVGILLNSTLYTGQRTGVIVAYTNDPYVLRVIIQNNLE